MEPKWTHDARDINDNRDYKWLSRRFGICIYKISKNGLAGEELIKALTNFMNGFEETYIPYNYGVKLLRILEENDKAYPMFLGGDLYEGYDQKLDGVTYGFPDLTEEKTGWIIDHGYNVVELKDYLNIKDVAPVGYEAPEHAFKVVYKITGNKSDISLCKLFNKMNLQRYSLATIIALDSAIRKGADFYINTRFEGSDFTPKRSYIEEISYTMSKDKDYDVLYIIESDNDDNRVVSTDGEIYMGASLEYKAPDC